VSCAKTAVLIEMLFRVWTRVSQVNHMLDGVQIRTREGAVLMAIKGRQRTYPVVDILTAAQQRAELVQCGWRLGCTRWGTRWRNLPNMIEPSVCGGDAALCQSTLTTC